MKCLILLETAYKERGMTMERIERELLEAISENQLQSFKNQFIKETSFPVAKKELRSFQYAKEVLEILGVEAKLSFHDSFISLPIHARLSFHGEEFLCSAHSMSTSTGEIGLNGKLRYVTCWQENIAPSKEIFVTEGMVSSEIVKMAEKAGAKAIVFIEGESVREALSLKSEKAKVDFAQKYFAGIPVLAMSEKEGEKLKNSWSAAPEEACCWLMTEVETGWREIPTLTAGIRSQASQDFIQVSSTIDSAESAGTNAVLLEMARVLSLQNLFLDKSVRLLFLSKHYQASWEEQQSECLLHLHLDAGHHEGFELRKGGLPATVRASIQADRSNRKTEAEDLRADCLQYMAILFEACTSQPPFAIETDEEGFKQAK